MCPRPLVPKHGHLCGVDISPDADPSRCGKVGANTAFHGAFEVTTVRILPPALRQILSPENSSFHHVLVHGPVRGLVLLCVFSLTRQSL